MFVPLHDHLPRLHVRVPFVTWGLIAATIATWLTVQAGATLEGEFATLLSWAVVPALITDHAVLPASLASIPEPVTLVSYMFLHGGFLHLAGNMLFLWVFGDNIEDAVGHVRFLAFYLLCGVAGALAHVVAFPASEAPLIGASGAVSGIVAAYLMLHPRVQLWVLAFGRIPLRLPAALVLGAWVAMQVFNVLVLTEDGTAWFAHLGGLVAGALLIVPFRREGVPLFDRGLSA